MFVDRRNNCLVQCHYSSRHLILEHSKKDLGQTSLCVFFRKPSLSLIEGFFFKKNVRIYPALSFSLSGINLAVFFCSKIIHNCASC